MDFFIGLTTLGTGLWVSLLLRHPFDLNKYIALILDSIG